MYYWHKELDFLTRLIIGSILAFALLGILSYYLGLMGLHVKYHGIIIPLILYGLGLVFIVIENHSNKNEKNEKASDY